MEWYVYDTIQVYKKISHQQLILVIKNC